MGSLSLFSGGLYTLYHHCYHHCHHHHHHQTELLPLSIVFIHSLCLCIATGTEAYSFHYYHHHHRHHRAFTTEEKQGFRHITRRNGTRQNHGIRDLRKRKGWTCITKNNSRHIGKGAKHFGYFSRDGAKMGRGAKQNHFLSSGFELYDIVAGRRRGGGFAWFGVSEYT